MTEPATLSDLLRNVTKNIDLDLAQTIAEVINIYHGALRRIANRSVLGPEDAIRILHITNSIISACQGEGDPEIIPGAPTRAKVEKFQRREAAD